MQTHEIAPGASLFSQQPQPIIIKPRLVDLINTHHVSMIHLARASRLQVDVVHAMALRGEAVQPVVAMQVLCGLLALTGTRYALRDVDISIQSYCGARSREER